MCLPEALHLVESQFSQGATRVGCRLLHSAESRNEFFVGAFECRFGVDAVQTTSIDYRKQQVAKLALQEVVIFVCNLNINLCALFADLIPDILALLPIEADRCRLLADTKSFDKCRKAAWYATEGAALAILLAQFKRFPIVLNLFGSVGVDISIDVRVAVDEFVAYAICHIGIVECALLRAEFRVEDNVQQQVAQLLLDALHITVGNGIDEFVGLFDCVVAQRLEGLLTVPRTLLAQSVHNLYKTQRCVCIFVTHININDYRDKVSVFGKKNISLAKLFIRNRMKTSLKLTILSLVTLVSATAFAVIPQPRTMESREGVFELCPSTTIAYNADELRPLAHYMLEYLAVKNVSQQVPESDFISVELQSGLAEEEYRLSVTPRGVRIVASDYGGAFNAVQTLFQLMPGKVYAKNMCLPVTLSACEIADAPQLAYRGVMLDVARTWVDVEGVKRYIDWLSYHKINRLHWHLSDDQGWRIEIKAYPELAKVGGYRGGTSPVPPMYGKWNESYGGFYTQTEIRDIVEYALRRNVEIIPEIDLPGHSWAFAMMHPEVVCRYEYDEGHCSGGIDTRNVFCATREENYKMLDTIFSEVCKLFPSEYIHIGGDEVSLSQWEKCPDCSAYLRRHGYTDAHKLEDLFMARMADILAKFGKRPAVWNEGINGGGLDKSTRVHGWSKMADCRKVLEAGYPTIFMPAEYFYFDMRQSKYETGSNWSNIFDVKHTYSFDFAEQGFPAEQVALVEGIECAFWSEIALSQGGDRSTDYLEYMTFPRVCAVAEIGWGKNGSDWANFYARLTSAHYDRMSAMGINYRLMPPTVKYADGMLSASTDDGSKIYYTTENAKRWNRYVAPFKCDKPGLYIFRSEFLDAHSPIAAHDDHYKTIKPSFALTSSIESGRSDGYVRVEEYRGRVTTKRTCRKGDWFLFEFDEPVRCREMEFITGYTHIAHRLFPSGYIEVSVDGERFERGAALIDGCAKIVNPSTPIKAVRIVSTTDRNSSKGVTINPPVIKPIL